MKKWIKTKNLEMEKFCIKSVSGYRYVYIMGITVLE